MILTNVPPPARGQGICDIDRVWLRVTQKKLKKKIGKSWHGRIKPIFRQMRKLELSVLFSRAGTFQFFSE